MKRIAFILTAFAALFFCVNSYASVPIGADESKIITEAYVSSSAGDDSNDGSKNSLLRHFPKFREKMPGFF